MAAAYLMFRLLPRPDVSAAFAVHRANGELQAEIQRTSIQTRPTVNSTLPAVLDSR